jgi:hypothetical protein
VPWLVVVRSRCGDGRFRQSTRTPDRSTVRALRAYALVEIGDDQAVDVFVRREDAFAALEDAIRDEPDWAGILYVAPIELDGRSLSAN